MLEARTRRHRGSHLVKVEIEVDSLDQLREVLDCGLLADVVLIDNFDVASMKKAVEMVGGKLVIEASGGITLDNIADIAATGVDYASSGSLTLSAPALDIGLDIEIWLSLEPLRRRRGVVRRASTVSPDRLCGR